MVSISMSTGRGRRGKSGEYLAGVGEYSECKAGLAGSRFLGLRLEFRVRISVTV